MTELKLVKSLVDNRYELLERIGRGSYAEIYIGKDRHYGGKFVIIKALNTNLQGTPDAELEQTLKENFDNESRALDAVQHPNIIRRLGGGKAADLIGQVFQYLVLEYMPGGDLLNRCRQKPFTLQEVILYIGQVCDALHHAHQRNIIHRDIKPNNLLLSADSKVVKITDFGVAKISPQVDEEVTRVGTDIYAPPEHHPMVSTSELISPSGLTPSADIYSLAKTIYTLLSGRPPRQFKERPITQLPPELEKEEWADDLLSILRRATDSQVGKRYADAASFFKDLEGLLEADPETTRVKSSSKRAAVNSAVNPAINPVVDPAVKPNTAPLSLDPEFQDKEAETARLQVEGRRSGRIVIELPRKETPAQVVNVQTKTETSVQKVEKKEKPAAKEKAQAKITFWEKADTFLFNNRRKILTIWAIFLFLVLTIFIAGRMSSMEVIDQEKTVYSSRAVSVRSGPGTSSGVVGWVKDGAKMKVVKREPNNWCLVDFIDSDDMKTANVKRGWVYGDFLRNNEERDSQAGGTEKEENGK